MSNTSFKFNCRISSLLAQIEQVKLVLMINDKTTGREEKPSKRGFVTDRDTVNVSLLCSRFLSRIMSLSKCSQLFD